MTRVRRFIRRFLGREDGTASIEFVIAVPVIMTIFMASIEAGFYMAKHVSMERGLDMVIREVRLGFYNSVSHDLLRDRICELTPILSDCSNTLKVEMTTINMNTFAMPATPATCVDRGNSVQPLTEFVHGGSNEFMVVRICAVQDPIFPSTGVGLQLRADAQGGYQMVSASIFVKEPS
jgi:TadE-like protein